MTDFTDQLIDEELQEKLYNALNKKSHLENLNLLLTILENIDKNGLILKAKNILIGLKDN